MKVAQYGVLGELCKDTSVQAGTIEPIGFYSSASVCNDRSSHPGR